MPLIFESWFLLFYCELIMRCRDFKTLHAIVRAHGIKKLNSASNSTLEDLCRGVDLACCFYFRQVLCLQRSAATTLLLRRHGFAAEMAIGVQIMPFESHAWVEVEGHIVNDEPYLTDTHKVLERW